MDVKTTLKVFEHLYGLLYDQKIPESREMVEKCDSWMRTHKKELAALVHVRQDLFVSDRELNALALALDL